MTTSSPCTAFADGRILASGDAATVALAVKAAQADGRQGILILEDATGREIDFDLRGSDDDVRARHAGPAASEPERQGRGRPRLGVVAREVTLLPRHWDWLAAQPGGASAALRRLVDEARTSRSDEDALRAARDAAYRAMSALAGDRVNFEEASRALYANDLPRLQHLLKDWPDDVAAYILRLSDPANRAL
jgi:hypothetical protein